MSKTETLYGFHPVFEALRAGRRRFFEIYFATEGASGRYAPIRARALQESISVKQIPRDELNKMAGSPFTQGIAARVTPYPAAELSDALKKSKSAGDFPFLLLMDNILDPQNLGALIRTGLCAGVHGVVIPKDRSTPPTPAVSKASSGALEHIFLVRVTNLTTTIESLKESGIWVFGMERHATTTIFSQNLTGPVALVVGGEEKGIRPLVRRHCDGLFSIPQSGNFDSLNASVAGGIAMFEVFRQRHPRPFPQKGR
ncbi:MAG: 23S rRNA (guanosine(2251)-2'-O)-methyltransferase RlmB [Pseudomonadota bacterium]